MLHMGIVYKVWCIVLCIMPCRKLVDNVVNLIKEVLKYGNNNQ